MRNVEIVAQYKVMNNIDLEAPLYTYQVWKSLGYQVKKGETAKHKIVLWKHTKKEIENKETGEKQKQERCFGKTCCLFELSQVEKIAK